MQESVGALLSRRGALVVAAALTIDVACSSSDDSTFVAHGAGTEQGPCLEGDVCSGALVCLSHTCVALPGSDGSSGASGSSGAMASGGRVGAGGSGGTSVGGSSAAGGVVVSSGGASGAANGGAGGGAAGADASAGGIGGSAGAGGGSAGTTGGTAGASTGGAAGASGGAGGTTGGAAGTSGTGGNSGSSGAGGGVDGGTCSLALLPLMPAPLDVYVLFDRSLSMNDTVNGGTTKWTAITTALSTFVQNPSSSGTSIGLGYFPLVVANPPPPCQNDVDCGQYGPCDVQQMTCQKADACRTANYAPAVPIALLPGVSQTIVDSLAANTPGGFTPTYPALQATYQYARAWASSHRSDQTIVVLATDGDPTTCDSSTNNINTIATNLVAPALAGDPPVRTFVVGVGSSLTSMNQIAAAGGTQQAFIVDTAAPDAGTQFVDAMTAITHSTSLGCEYRIPTPPGGGTLDLSTASVQIKIPSVPPTKLPAVADRSACTVSTGGWYFENTQKTPEKVVLCASTCTALRATAGATVEVAGCAM